MIGLPQRANDLFVEMLRGADGDFMAELQESGRAQHDDQQPDDKQQPLFVEVAKRLHEPGKHVVRLPLRHRRPDGPPTVLSQMNALPAILCVKRSLSRGCSLAGCRGGRRLNGDEAFGVAGLEVEQAEDLRGGEAQRGVRRLAVAQDRLEQFALLAEDQVDPLFDRVLADEAGDDHRVFLSDAVRPVDRLVLDGRVPPAVKQEDIAGKLQIESDRPRAVAH